MKLSTVLTLFVLVAVGAASFAAAATLSVASASLGSGRVAAAVCDSDGFTYTHTLNTSHAVTTVTVSGINAACAGGTLQITLANSSNASIGSGSAALPSSGFLGWATVTIAGAPPSANVTSYRVAIS